MKIQAAVLEQPHQPFQIQNIVLNQELRPYEVLVKVIAAGLCHTDLSIRDQHIPAPFPVILGHEGAGIVHDIGSGVTSISKGDRVVLAPSSCGRCINCLSGHPSYCVNLYSLNMPGSRKDGSYPYEDQNGKHMNGFFFGQSSFGTYSLTNENNVVKVDEGVPLEIMGPLGCGIQTGAGTVLNVLRPGAGESIVIFGVGPVGLASIMAAKASGCTTIIAVDIHENRLALAMGLGATHHINSKKENPVEAVKRILADGVQYSVDTTGRNEIINHAIGSLRFMGKCALIAIPSSPTLTIEYSVLNSGRSIQVVVEGDSVPRLFIPKLIELYKKGLFPFDKLIRFYELEEINQAVADTEKGITLKAIIRMPQ